MHSLPKILVSIETIFVACQYMGALFNMTTYPVLDLLVTSSQACSVYRKYSIDDSDGETLPFWGEPLRSGPDGYRRWRRKAKKISKVFCGENRCI